MVVNGRRRDVVALLLMKVKTLKGGVLACSWLAVVFRNSVAWRKKVFRLLCMKLNNLECGLQVVEQARWARLIIRSCCFHNKRYS